MKCEKYSFESFDPQLEGYTAEMLTKKLLNINNNFDYF